MAKKPQPQVATESRTHEDEVSDTYSDNGALARVLASAQGRVTVNKAYKMFVGGAFVRSESGRYFQVKGAESVDPETVNVPRGSRKDARDAVIAAKNALDGGSGRTAFNRGQILYRLAEVMESRKEELRQSLVRGGESDASASEEVERAI